MGIIESLGTENRQRKSLLGASSGTSLTTRDTITSSREVEAYHAIGELSGWGRVGHRERTR